MQSMIQQDEKGTIIPMQQQQDQPQHTNYLQVNKHQYKNKVFCWIESGNSSMVIKFFNTFPHLLNQIITSNNWNPYMYAIRYGNIQLIQYFEQKKAKINEESTFNQVSAVHAAVYSGQNDILQYVLSHLEISPNPSNCQTSPLKCAMKAGNAKMIEMLICKGAYYIFGQVYNNIEIRTTNDEPIKYISLITKKQINNSLVVQNSALKQHPIKQALRWSRLKQLMYLHRYAKIHHQDIQNKQQQHPFKYISAIFNNDQYFKIMLQLSIGNGNSLIIPSDTENKMKQKKQKCNK